MQHWPPSRGSSGALGLAAAGECLLQSVPAQCWCPATPETTDILMTSEPRDLEMNSYVWGSLFPSQLYPGPTHLKHRLLCPCLLVSPLSY